MRHGRHRSLCNRGKDGGRVTDKLKIHWPHPKVAWNGRGISEALLEAMEGYGFQPTGKDEAEIAFFVSDSQLDGDVIQLMPSICCFWGWDPARIRVQGFPPDAGPKLDALKRCTRVLVPTPNTRDQLAMLGIASDVCLPGVDLKHLGRQQPSTQRKLQVVFVSRLAEQKNLTSLLQAMSLLEPRVPLVVIGPGDADPYRAMAESLRVPTAFLEPTDEEKAIILAESALLVHPSRYEGFGLPPLEAMSVGTPVIAWNLPVLRWTLEDNAYFANDVNELASQIVHVLSNYASPEIEDLVKRAQAFVASRYTMDHFARRLWPHLHQVAKAWWGARVKGDPFNKALIQEAYEAEGRRNWAYGMGPDEWQGAARFNPEWQRHWRAQAYIRELKAAGVKRLLDLGCGPVYPCIFGLNGFDVTGFDISEETLSQARHVAKKWGVGSRVTTRQGRAQELPWGESVWDGVVLGEIIEHVPDPEKVLSEAYRVVKPGGIVALTSPVQSHHWDPMHLGTAGGGWDDAGMAKLLAPYGDQVILNTKIAEDGTEPSCYLAVIKKRVQKP